MSVAFPGKHYPDRSCNFSRCHCSNALGDLDAASRVLGIIFLRRFMMSPFLTGLIAGYPLKSSFEKASENYQQHAHLLQPGALPRTPGHP